MPGQGTGVRALIAPMPWTQVYAPLGGTAFSAAAAAAPLVLIFALLASGRVPGWLAALASTVSALMLAVLAWGMPADAALSAAGYGAAFALFPILWIVIAALWVFSLSTESGQFAVIRTTLAGMSPDRRLQALFIAFAFGAFLEGTAGFGTPVAITAAMLVGLGFDPRYAAAICLVANSAPVAFAAAGVPVAAAAQVSGLDVMTISRILGLQLPVLSLLVPLWLCVILCGWRRSMEVLPAIAVSGIAMAGSQFALASYAGPYVTGVASGLFTVGVLALFLRAWKPPTVWDFPAGAGRRGPAGSGPRPGPVSFMTALRAWAPFLIMSILVLAWGTDPVKRLLAPVGAAFPWPGLHGRILKTAPITPGLAPYPALFAFSFGPAAGTAIFLAGIVSAFVLPGVGLRGALRCMGRTLRDLRTTILTVCLVIATAYIMNYSGMSSSLGIALSATGALFPLFSPLLGWLGVLLTGSDTSSNALFCSLQRTTAEQLGLNPALAVAANSAGGVSGKMISPQSISVAVASARIQGQEGWLFRFTVGHSVAMALLISLITLALAYLVPSLVPR
jgi:lactate permease